MSKFSIDYDKLSTTIDKKKYKLSEVKDRVVKVAFDIVKFRDDDCDQLWKIESSDDGDFIVALYNDNKETTIKSASLWEAVANKKSGDLNIFYKNEPIMKVSASSLGIPREELNLVEKYLPSKLASNKDFVNKLLKNISASSKKELFRKYPELA